MERREFLKSLGIGAWVALGPGISFAAPPERGYRNLFVLVELKGGNDGLNTVVPYGDAQYYALRPRIGIARDQVLQLTQYAGFHPSLEALMPLWHGGQLAVLQGVGYPNPNLSHFRSIDIWDTASDSSQYLDEGWLARTFAVDSPPREFAADGIVVGSSGLGPLAGGSVRAIALSDPQQFLRQSRLAGTPGHSNNPALNHIIKVEQDIIQAASKLNADYQFKTEFPKGEFGNAIKTASHVAASQGGVAVIRVSVNGFDTHGNQPGTQARLLRELAEGLAAFKLALAEIDRWNSTLIMTYAEFGRRPRENLSNGTDHGTANVHFMLGGGVKGGLYGPPPPLDRLDGSGNLPFAVDFRSLYATVIERWWGLPPAQSLGGRFSALDLIKA